MDAQTIDELTRLQQEAKQDAGETTAGELAGMAFAGLDALIESLPDEHEQADLPGGIADPSAPRRAILPIHVGKGWPERYCGELDEPRGGEWLAGFTLVAPVIESGGIVLLHGTRGTGKSRMAAEIARAGRFPLDQTRGKKIEGNTEPRRTAVYRTAMRFFLDLRATYRKSSEVSERDVIDALTEPGLLCLDELQERGETAFENRMLTHLIDARYNAMRSTILIANLPKTELEAALGPSITDRVAENGRRIEFTWNSYRRAKR